MSSEKIIRFTEADFGPILASHGVDIKTMLDEEWDQFYDSFVEGTAWNEVADLCARDIAEGREENE